MRTDSYIIDLIRQEHEYSFPLRCKLKTKEDINKITFAFPSPRATDLMLNQKWHPEVGHVGNLNFNLLSARHSSSRRHQQHLRNLEPLKSSNSHVRRLSLTHW